MTDRELTDTQLSHMIIDWKNGVHYSSIIWLCRQAIAADRVLLATPAPAQPDPLHVANERGEGWQPIESVPGTPEPVLLWTRAGAVRVETGWYAKNLLDESKEDDFECAFTHWRQQLAGPASPTPETDHG